MKELGNMQKVVEEEKERMISYWKYVIKEIDNQVGRTCYSNTNIRVSSRDNIRDYNRENINGENIETSMTKKMTTKLLITSNRDTLTM